MYYWGNKDASVSFCEPAYKDSIYIAEYYNTFSGFIYCFLGLYFLKTDIKNMGYTLISLGTGTVLLHATQRWYGQWLDELSMLYLSFQIIKRIRYLRNQKTPNWIALIGLLTYIYFFETYVIFILLFSGAQLQILNDVKYLKPKEKKKWIFDLSILIYKVSFIISSILWILDHLLCKNVEFLKLHAIWHIGTGISIFFGLNNLLICDTINI